MSSSSQDQTKSKPSGPTTSRSRWIEARKPKPESSVDAAHSAVGLDQMSSAQLFDPANAHSAISQTSHPPSSKSNNTALAELKQVLPALSAMSRSASLPGLDVAFDSLLTIITKFETMLEDLEGFGYLVIHLKKLQPTLSRFDGASKASADLDQLLDPLRREIESLRSDIDKAGSCGGLERFVNSTEGASSLASHNVRLDRIISQLAVSRASRDNVEADKLKVDVTASTSHSVNETLQGVSRIKNGSSRSGESAAGGITQLFRGAKINTVGSGNGTGGHVGSANLGIQLQDYENADITTGGGNVGANNTSLAALRLAPDMRLKLRDAKSGILV